VKVLGQVRFTVIRAPVEVEEAASVIPTPARVPEPEPETVMTPVLEL
jgi:hypothetical protein